MITENEHHRIDLSAIHKLVAQTIGAVVALSAETTIQCDETLPDRKANAWRSTPETKKQTLGINWIHVAAQFITTRPARTKHAKNKFQYTAPKSAKSGQLTSSSRNLLG